MTSYVQDLNEDAHGVPTAAKYGDRGDSVNDWYQHVIVAAGVAVTGPVAVSSVVAGTGATNLGKAEDAAHASGDVGVMALGVRKNTPVSTAGSDSDYMPAIFDTNGAQWVHPIQSALTIESDSAGLETSTPAYTSGDQAGTEMTFAAAGNVSGWGGLIVAAVLLDKTQKIHTGDFELWLFDRSVTGAGDNAAAVWSDADMAHCVGRIKWLTADWVDFSTTNSHNQQTGLSIPYTCNATSLFGTFVTRQGNAVYGAASDLRVSLRVLRD